MPLSEPQPAFFTLQQQGEIVIARFVVANLNDEENIDQLGQELFTLVDQYGFLKVALNLGVVEYVTSSVLGKFITLHRKLHRVDGKLVICGLQKIVADVMRTSKLSQYFNVADDEAGAIGMLQ